MSSFDEAITEKLKDERDRYREAVQAGDIVISTLINHLEEYVSDIFDTIPELEIELGNYNRAVQAILGPRQGRLSGSEVRGRDV